MLNNPALSAATGDAFTSRPPFAVSGAVEGFDNEVVPSYLLRSAADHERHVEAEFELTE